MAERLRGVARRVGIDRSWCQARIAWWQELAAAGLAVGRLRESAAVRVDIEVGGDAREEPLLWLRSVEQVLDRLDMRWQHRDEPPLATLADDIDLQRALRIAADIAHVDALRFTASQTSRIEEGEQAAPVLRREVLIPRRRSP